MQVSPSKPLAGFIKHYIFLKNTEKDHKDLRLFADGNTGLILSPDMNMRDGTKQSLPLSFFYGQPTVYKDLYTKGEFSLLAVVFQPYFFNLLFDVSAKEIKNEIISAADILKDQLLPFQEKLYRKNDPKSLINDLDSFFLKLITQKNVSELWLVKAQQYLLKNKGMASLKKLQYYTGYSERHIERIFENHIGISPKRYNTIIRLHYFFEPYEEYS